MYLNTHKAGCTHGSAGQPKCAGRTQEGHGTRLRHRVAADGARAVPECARSGEFQRGLGCNARRFGCRPRCGRGCELAAGGAGRNLDSDRGMNSQNQTAGGQTNRKAEEEEDDEVAWATQWHGEWGAGTTSGIP